MATTRGIQRSILTGFIHWLIDAGTVTPGRMPEQMYDGLSDEEVLELERARTVDDLVESYFTDMRKDVR